MGKWWLNDGLMMVNDVLKGMIYWKNIGILMEILSGNFNQRLRIVTTMMRV